MSRVLGDAVALTLAASALFCQHAVADEVHPNLTSEIETRAASESLAFCPVHTNGLFVHVLRVDDRFLDRLFGAGGSWLRTVDQLPRGEDGLRRMLGRMTDSKYRSLQGAGALCSFFSESFAASLVSQSGDGIALSVKPDESLFRLSLCLVPDSSSVGASTTRTLLPGQLLLCRIATDRRPAMLAAWVLPLTREQLLQRQRNFLRDVSKANGVNESGFLVEKPDARLQECLSAE